MNDSTCTRLRTSQTTTVRSPVCVCTQVNAAVEAAKTAPLPVDDEMWTDIYTDQSKDFFMRGCDMTVSKGVYGTTK
eukprot:6204369-Pleurochrysis_carterae.AAC.1